MLKKYPETFVPHLELKQPSHSTLQAILNYSKSIEVKKLKDKKSLILNLN